MSDSAGKLTALCLVWRMIFELRDADRLYQVKPCQRFHQTRLFCIIQMNLSNCVFVNPWPIFFYFSLISPSLRLFSWVLQIPWEQKCLSWITKPFPSYVQFYCKNSLVRDLVCLENRDFDIYFLFGSLTHIIYDVCDIRFRPQKNECLV